MAEVTHGVHILIKDVVFLTARQCSQLPKMHLSCLEYISGGQMHDAITHSTYQSLLPLSTTTNELTGLVALGRRGRFEEGLVASQSWASDAPHFSPPLKCWQGCDGAPFGGSLGSFGCLGGP